jgi:hypothetical protein
MSETPMLPRTQEEWLEFFKVYQSTEGCGCCRDSDATVSRLRTVVAEAVQDPAHQFPLSMPGQDPVKHKAKVDAYFQAQHALRQKWITRLGGKVPTAEDDYE